MSKTKTTRITSGNREIQTTPDGSLPPHMAHLRRKRRDRPTERQRERKALAAGEARRNDTVELVCSLTTPARKRGGARYGPAPEKHTYPWLQAPKPMSAVVRADNWGEGGNRLANRQERQLYRMALRAGVNISRGLDAKGRATPKRKATR